MKIKLKFALAKLSIALAGGVLFQIGARISLLIIDTTNIDYPFFLGILAPLFIGMLVMMALGRREGPLWRLSLAILPMVAAGIVTNFYVTSDTLAPVTFVFIYLSALFGLRLGRTDWEHSHAKFFLNTGSVWLAVFILVTIGIGRSFAILDALLFFGFCLLGVGLSHEVATMHYVKFKFSHHNSLAYACAIMLLLLVWGVSVVTQQFEISLWYNIILTTIFNVIYILMLPIIYLIYGLINFFGLILRLIGTGVDSSTMLERITGMQEALQNLRRNAVTEAVPTWLVQGVFAILILVGIIVAYLLIVQQRSEKIRPYDEERESILAQGLGSLSLRKYLRLPRLPKGLSKDPQNIVQLFEWILYWGKKKHHEKLPNETASEYIDSLAISLPQLETKEILTGFLQFRYGEKELEHSQWQRAKAAWRQVKTKINERKGRKKYDNAT